jgi:hypothetical protein
MRLFQHIEIQEVIVMVWRIISLLLLRIVLPVFAGLGLGMLLDYWQRNQAGKEIKQAAQVKYEPNKAQPEPM